MRHTDGGASPGLGQEPRALKVVMLVKLPKSLGTRLEVNGAVEGSGADDSPLRRVL